MTQLWVGIDPICYWHPLPLLLLVFNVIPFPLSVVISSILSFIRLPLLLLLHPLKSYQPVDTQIDLPSPFPLSAGKYWLVCTFNNSCQMPKGKIEGFCTRNYLCKDTACVMMPPCFWQDGKRSIYPSLYLSIYLFICHSRYLTTYNIYEFCYDNYNNNRISRSDWEISPHYPTLSLLQTLSLTSIYRV